MLTWEPTVAPSAGLLMATSGPLVSAGFEFPRQPATRRRGSDRRSRKDRRIRLAPLGPRFADGLGERRWFTLDTTGGARGMPPFGCPCPSRRGGSSGERAGG